MAEHDDNLSSPKSWYFFLSTVFTLTSTLIIFIAFFSPYWLESYEKSCSDFVKLGLWNVCFRNYRHPMYHIDQTFDGCNWIYSYKYQGIHGWLQPGTSTHYGGNSAETPIIIAIVCYKGMFFRLFVTQYFPRISTCLVGGWFILTQLLMSSGLVFSAMASVFIGLLLMHYLTAFKVFVLAVAFVLAALSSLLVFLAVCVFGSMCFDRAWIQYPNYNHLSWSFGMAIIGFLLEGCASGLLLTEAFRLSRHVYRGTVSYTVPSDGI